MLTVELTKEQQNQVAELIEQANTAYNKDEPGIVIAQVFEDRMHVGFLTHEKAKKFEREAKSL